MSPQCFDNPSPPRYRPGSILMRFFTWPLSFHFSKICRCKDSLSIGADLFQSHQFRQSPLFRFSEMSPSGIISFQRHDELHGGQRWTWKKAETSPLSKILRKIAALHVSSIFLLEIFVWVEMVLIVFLPFYFYQWSASLPPLSFRPSDAFPF